MILDKEESLIEGIKNKNSIIYKDSDVSIKIIIDDSVRLIRENNEFKMEMLFDKNKQTTCKYLLKEYNKCLDLLLETKMINYDDNHIDILYRIIDSSDDYINFKLEFEEI